ncbi:hypothetical protein [Flexivirga alba]|uniref:Uncharacterized protein n=1 Tax=Flexivirga alba TaxID=702742 RepID=A0ABW2AFH8_9MICO
MVVGDVPANCIGRHVVDVGGSAAAAAYDMALVLTGSRVFGSR